MEAFVNNMTKNAPADPQKSSMGPGTRSNYPQFRTITTRWMDNDVYGHVNNVVYYSFFDTAVNADFGDVEETAILVTIADIYLEKKERHLDF